MDEEVLKGYISQLHGEHLESTLDKIKQAVKAGDAKGVTMSIPILLALTICPAMLGTQEAIRQSQSKQKREEHRARRCNLVASCVKPSIRSRDINDKLVVLKDAKLYISSQSSSALTENDQPTVDGHPFAGYFLPYPDTSYEGIVSTITEDPPMLNWIYVDRNTYEVKYGLRVDAQDHITGPFDCTKQDRRMTLESWEGFVAVEEFPGVWALYFDRDDNGLEGKIPFGTRVLEIELTRREKKERKPQPDIVRAQTLDEKWKEHKEQSAKEEADRAEFLKDDREKPALHGTNTIQQAEAIPLPESPALEGQAEHERHDSSLHLGEWAGVSRSREDDELSVGSKTAVTSTYGDDAGIHLVTRTKGVPEFYVRPYVEEVTSP